MKPKSAAAEYIENEGLHGKLCYEQDVSNAWIAGHASREPEVAELKRETPAMCAYCSFELPKGAKLEELQRHINRCEHHPLVKEVNRLDLNCTKLRNERDKLTRELNAQELVTIGVTERAGEVIAGLKEQVAQLRELLERIAKEDLDWRLFIQNALAFTPAPSEMETK